MSNSYEDNIDPELEPSLMEQLLPRLPVAIVLAVLLANTGLALYGQWSQHEALAQSEARMESMDTQKALAQGQMIDQKLSDLVHAVAALAATDPEAQKIVTDLHISVGGSSPVPVASPMGK